MRTRFEENLELVLKHEGGYVDHPADKGGATNRGITQAVYDTWRAGQGIGRQPVSGISGEEVAAIYKARYWLMGKCDKMPAPLDYVHFDGCVNHGVQQATKFLQRAIGVEADGVIGPKTLAALQEDVSVGYADEICRSILDQREAFYQRIVERNPSQKAFIRGWLSRLVSIRERVLT